MKLKNRFDNLVPKEFGGMQEPLLSDCVKIAEQFAIEFLDSIRDYERECRQLICFDERDSKELLEIFKEKK
jgi:hypothetical protein